VQNVDIRVGAANILVIASPGLFRIKSGPARLPRLVDYEYPGANHRQTASTNNPRIATSTTQVDWFARAMAGGRSLAQLDRAAFNGGAGCATGGEGGALPGRRPRLRRRSPACRIAYKKLADGSSTSRTKGHELFLHPAYLHAQQTAGPPRLREAL